MNSFIFQDSNNLLAEMLNNPEYKYLGGDYATRQDTKKQLDNAFKKVQPPMLYGHKSILAVGKVQSGKTSHFTGLLAVSLDNGYNISIILGGVTTLLTDQNLSRLNSVFGSLNDVHLVITSQVFDLHPMNVVNDIKNGSKYIFVIMKQKDHLEKIKSLFYGAGNELKKINCLIIDDEADNASIANSNYPTTINSLIQDIHLNLFSTTTYVSYTATPYANLFIKQFDWQKAEELIMIKEGKGYCGLDYFHHPYKKSFNNLHVVEELNSLVLFEVLTLFLFLCGHIRELGFKKKSNFDLIIHSERLNKNNFIIEEEVKGILTEIATCKNETRLKLIKSVQKYINSSDENYINNKIQKSIRNTKIKKLFGDDTKKIPDGSKNVIYIGADVLGRGVTFQSLVVYIDRNAKINSIDTYLQRARWFGYRDIEFNEGEKWTKYMHIFMDEKTMKTYENISLTEDYLWKAIDLRESKKEIYANVAIPTVTFDIDLLPTSKDKLGQYEVVNLISGLIDGNNRLDDFQLAFIHELLNQFDYPIGKQEMYIYVNK